MNRFTERPGVEIGNGLGYTNVIRYRRLAHEPVVLTRSRVVGFFIIISSIIIQQNHSSSTSTSPIIIITTTTISILFSIRINIGVFVINICIVIVGSHYAHAFCHSALAAARWIPIRSAKRAARSNGSTMSPRAEKIVCS
jgi:hypothetical protein